ncbi:MAG: hypothetical protein ACJA0U_001155 [Salibacteraceae bacterium]|jgi:hypothetical protein
MKTILSILFVSFYFVSFGQNWADDVSTIFYQKCAQCHHTGGAAPFPLTTYGESSPIAGIIQNALTTDEMPPWPPNNNYQSYSHDRSLSVSEKTTVLDWISNGAPEGNAANTPPVPTFQTGSIYGAGDLEVQIPTYMSKASTNDDYVCFALPSGLATNRIIKAVEIVPGNPEIVHHCLIYIDPTNSSVTDTVGGDCGGPSSSNATLVTGYTPGSTPMTLPDAAPLKLGMPMPANSQIVFAMHFPEGSYGEFDSTKVIFHFYPPGEPGIREVIAAPIIQDWGFALPPNQVTDLSVTYPGGPGLPIDYSLLSVFPHMHLLGQEMEVYGIQPNLDTLKLIQLEWDFEWQDFYFYKNIQKIEAGANIHAEASFDNTSANPNNPNSPPQWVGAGLNTSDEMFLVYMHYMTYLPGDELYNLDSLMGLSSLSLVDQSEGPSQFSLYPNPFHDGVNIYSNNVSTGDKVSVYVYSAQGKLIKPLMKAETLTQNELLIEWDGTNQTNAPAASGLYFISVNINGVMTQHRVIKQ